MNERIAALDHRHLWHPFTQQRGWEREEPLVVERGEGTDLIDTDGTRYIDGTSSLWCNVHGHRHPTIDGAIRDQLDRVAQMLGAPLITGKTSNFDRERLYAKFRSGEIRLLVISKVGNFAIDLPSANVAIQISGTFGSRQEEAQRLGRVLRPKPDGTLAHFYSIVTRDTSDQSFAANRQLFLTEQGYSYTIMDATTLLERYPAP